MFIIYKKDNLIINKIKNIYLCQEFAKIENAL